MKELQYPFDNELILKKSKSLKRKLLADTSAVRIHKKIAVLGGSTTHDIVKILELFLLDNGIEPTFYESEYNRYWQDAMFGNEELAAFAPDLIFIHTSNRNITAYPQLNQSPQETETLLQSQAGHFIQMWKKLEDTYHCPIIQNNMEPPFYRLLGNQDAVDIHGRLNFINRLNDLFYQYAREHENFYINDIHYLSACYGLDQWADHFFWHMYKYALCLPAIPALAFQIANIIKSIYGKNKKALVLDLDNTLWGGIVGDDGAENLEIGQETSMGQVYSEFQQYVKELKDLGVMLNVNSKNEEENALAGLNHPDGILRPEDFIVIKANWEPKSENIKKIAADLNILPESMVFADDNPAERELVRAQIPGAAVPEMDRPEHYIQILDKSGFFEVTSLSEDDKKRNEMYKANVLRAAEEESFADYGEYLSSLQMKAHIRPFEPMYMARISQLTNKSNQFNLTTRRYTQSEIEEATAAPESMTLYGKLEDKFGDNGVVTVVLGEQEGALLHLRLWLMSCRVLKRDMEYAMMDEVIEQCRKRNIQKIRGYYIPTAKNGMVRQFYAQMGFEKLSEAEDGSTIWEYSIPQTCEKKNHVIEVIR